MIRKFEDNDIDDIMQIWKSANIKAHNFILNEYWENNYEKENDFIITSLVLSMVIIITKTKDKINCIL